MTAPPPWRFRCYTSDDGIDQIRSWYDEAVLDVRRKFASRLVMLSTLPFADWQPPFFRWLERGIGEMRFKAAGVQQRPLGFRGPGENVFTIVFCATERGNKFVPRDAIQRAVDRKREIDSDAAHSIPCWLFDDPEFEASS